MGRLSATLLAELGKAAPGAVPLFAFTVAGTTYRYAESGCMGSGVGLYEPKVVSWGTSSRGVAQRQNTIEFGTVEVGLDDTDQAFTILVEGPNRNAVRGAASTIVLASPNVPTADWFTGYAGRIDSYQQGAPRQWVITLSPNDLPLQRESLPKGKVSVSDWPNSTVAARDQYVPILYGRISSANVANNGAVACPYVDQSGFRYLVCAGWAKSVEAVYVAGSPAAASAYAVTHPLVNGRRYTLIDFTSSQGANAVTCDVQGYETTGDGTGALITDPAAIMLHLIVNWIYGDYRSGAWLSSSTAPVDTVSFGPSYYSDRGIQGSLYIASKKRGQDVVNDFLKSHEAKAYWLASGKLALAIEDPTAWSYPSTVLRQDDQDMWSLSYPTANLIDSVEGQWSYSPNGGFQQLLRVADLRTGESAPEQVELPCSAAFLL